MLNNRFRSYAIIWLCLSSVLSAQDSNYDIFTLGFLYDDIKFDEVIIKGRELLQHAETYNKEQLGTIHSYMALAFYNLNMQDSSRAHFYTVLTLLPDYAPDPVKVSPKIVHFFDRIRTQFKSNQKAFTAVPYNRYIFVQDIRPSAGVYSLLLPGWGQYIKGQKEKAFWIAGVFSASLITTGLLYVYETQMKKNYENETDPTRINERYNAYNSADKMRRIFVYGTLAVWGYAIGDALWAPYHPLITVKNKKVALSLQWSF